MEFPDRSKRSLQQRWSLRRRTLRDVAQRVQSKQAPRPWTLEETDTLEQLQHAGMERKDIAERMGRSTSSIDAKIRYSQGMAKQMRVFWTEEEDIRLLQMRSERLGWRLISAALGRSTSACQLRYSNSLKYETAHTPKD